MNRCKGTGTEKELGKERSDGKKGIKKSGLVKRVTRFVNPSQQKNGGHTRTDARGSPSSVKSAQNQQSLGTVRGTRKNQRDKNQ